MRCDDEVSVLVKVHPKLEASCCCRRDGAGLEGEADSLRISVEFTCTLLGSVHFI